MALRVLLADESNTIKKVFQLALQDYAVEVRSVNVGVDVIAVAKQFQPDIIFADVLLQKRSGYEVSGDLKSHKDLKNIPVILIWSGFMELDHDKFDASKANAHLEKPFDVSSLRQLVVQFVEKTKIQRLSNYLTFPKIPDMESATRSKSNLDIPLPPPVPDNQSSTVTAGEMEVVNENIAESNWNMESFESIGDFDNKDQKSPPGNDENFSHHKLQPIIDPSEEKTKVGEPLAQNILDDLPSDDDELPWVQKDLSQFKIKASQHLDTNNEDEIPVEFSEPETVVKSMPEKEQLFSEEIGSEELELELMNEESPSDDKKVSDKPTPSVPQLSEEQLLEVIKAQSQETIEKVVWQVVPDLAKQIIERELQRLLDEKFSKE